MVVTVDAARINGLRLVPLLTGAELNVPHGSTLVEGSDHSSVLGGGKEGRIVVYTAGSMDGGTVMTCHMTRDNDSTAHKSMILKDSHLSCPPLLRGGYPCNDTMTIHTESALSDGLAMRSVGNAHEYSASGANNSPVPSLDDGGVLSGCVAMEART